MPVIVWSLKKESVPSSAASFNSGVFSCGGKVSFLYLDVDRRISPLLFSKSSYSGGIHALLYCDQLLQFTVVYGVNLSCK